MTPNKTQLTKKRLTYWNRSQRLSAELSRLQRKMDNVCSKLGHLGQAITDLDRRLNIREG
jgi:hypothetical protein